jgi:hypothetical protein
MTWVLTGILTGVLTGTHGVITGVLTDTQGTSSGTHGSGALMGTNGYSQGYSRVLSDTNRVFAGAPQVEIFVHGLRKGSFDVRVSAEGGISISGTAANPTALRFAHGVRPQQRPRYGRPVTS